MAPKPIKSAGLERVLSHTKKIMYSIELQTILREYQNKSHKKLIRDLLAQDFPPLGFNQTGFNLKIFHFNIH